MKRLYLPDYIDGEDGVVSLSETRGHLQFVHGICNEVKIWELGTNEVVHGKWIMRYKIGTEQCMPKTLLEQSHFTIAHPYMEAVFVALGDSIYCYNLKGERVDKRVEAMKYCGWFRYGAHQFCIASILRTAHTDGCCHHQNLYC